MPDQQSTSTANRREDLERSAVDQLHSALDAGDIEAARKAAEGVLIEERPIHDLYGDMCASFLTYIADKLGEDGVDEAWRHVANDVWRPVLEQFKASQDATGLATAFGQFLNSHRYDFSVWEDHEKWTFDVHYCTSGERMVVEGKVDGTGGDAAGHHRFGSTSKAYEWSLGREDFPYYDVHSVLWMKLLPAEWGWDVMDIEYDTKDHGEVAITKYVIYKEPRS